MERHDDSTRVVVSGLHHGGILPNLRSEMWREVFLRGPADVQGGVFGESVTTVGAGIRVRGSVYARGDVRVSAGDNSAPGGSVVFDSTVVTPRSLVVESVPFRTRFRSHVHCRTASFRNTIVYGNLYINSGVVRDAVVLGIVYGKGKVTFENCIVSFFCCDEAVLGEGVSLLCPMSMARAGITMKAPVQSLSFLNITSPAEAEERAGGVEMVPDDIHRITVPAENGSQEDQSWDVLSLGQRVLDSRPLLETFNENVRSLQKIALSGHLDPRLPEASGGGAVEQMEERLFSLLGDRNVTPLRGFSNVEELFDRMDVDQALSQFVGPDLTKTFREARQG